MRHLKKRSVYFFRYWFPIIGYCLVIYVQSSFRLTAGLPRFHHADKLAHAFVYALLAILFLRAYRSLPFGHRRLLISILSILSAWLYGIADEFHQVFVPHRHPDFWDALANGAGSLVGVALTETVSRIKTEVKKRIP